VDEAQRSIASGSGVRGSAYPRPYRRLREFDGCVTEQRADRAGGRFIASCGFRSRRPANNAAWQHLSVYVY
jgi:hypothetical protein